SLDVWPVVEHLVRRRVRFQVPLAFAWSREVRAGLRAADTDNWDAVMTHWTRAASASNPTTRRAAHFNVFIAHELAGRLDEARAHLMASQQEYPAPVGYSSSSEGGMRLPCWPRWAADKEPRRRAVAPQYTFSVRTDGEVVLQ